MIPNVKSVKQQCNKTFYELDKISNHTFQHSGYLCNQFNSEILLKKYLNKKPNRNKKKSLIYFYCSKFYYLALKEKKKDSYDVTTTVKF